MHFVEAIDLLSRRTNYEATGGPLVPSLDRIQSLAELLDNPQRSFPSIHVTGTNGKGTTALAATALLVGLERSVGTYTSPHLHSVRERIMFAGEFISEQDFASTYEYLAPYLDAVDRNGRPLTWFETMTAMSWVYFAERAVDVAVVEVGMGGTWDATNLVDGRVAVITKVGLDHKELGGTTIEVAGEKSGIVKHNSIVLTAEADPAVLEVIRKKCAKEGATLRRLGAEFALERSARAMSGFAFDVRIGDSIYSDLFVPMWSPELVVDAVLGLAAVDALLGDRGLDEEVVYKALSSVRPPGRVEALRRNPLVIVDGAHNPDAAAGLMKGMKSFSYDSLTVVIGMLADHFTPEYLREILPHAQQVIATQPMSARAMSASALGDEIAAMGVSVRVVDTVEEACEVALSPASGGDAVLITGSLYTVAAARERLLGERIVL